MHTATRPTRPAYTNYDRPLAPSGIHGKRQPNPQPNPQPNRQQDTQPAIYPYARVGVIEKPIPYNYRQAHKMYLNDPGDQALDTLPRFIQNNFAAFFLPEKKQIALFPVRGVLKFVTQNWGKNKDRSVIFTYTLKSEGKINTAQLEVYTPGDGGPSEVIWMDRPNQPEQASARPEPPIRRPQADVPQSRASTLHDRVIRTDWKNRPLCREVECRNLAVTQAGYCCVCADIE